jgi:hypothetical protein
LLRPKLSRRGHLANVADGSIASVGLSWHVGFTPTADISLRTANRRFGPATEVKVLIR